jgi:hypothetical protein
MPGNGMPQWAVYICEGENVLVLATVHSNESDASLMTAAPDLYEALRAAMPALRSIHDAGHPVLVQAEAALDLAEKGE